MKCNYIIATFGAYPGRRKYPYVDQTLRIHLQQLVDLRHHLSRITIVIPKQEKTELYHKYYDISNIPIDNIVFVECENKYVSCGQWLTAIAECRHEDFDYYFLVEDDYCPSKHHFDDTFLRIYRYKFPDNVGVLCSLVQGKDRNPGYGPYEDHFSGDMFMSKESINKLYERYDIPYNYLEITNVPQTAISCMFTHSGVPLEDYQNEYGFHYWDDGTYLFYIMMTPMTTALTCETLPFSSLDILDIQRNLCFPVQLAKKCVVLTDECDELRRICDGYLNVSCVSYDDYDPSYCNENHITPYFVSVNGDLKGGALRYKRYFGYSRDEEGVTERFEKFLF